MSAQETTSINNNLETKVSELISYWNIQENLLQNYRRLFLTLETILLSVAALSISRNLNNTSQIIIILSALIIGVLAAFFLIPIIKNRGEAVFYWQAKLLKAERGTRILQPLQEMKDFQKDKNHSFRSDPDFTSLSGGKNLTRRKLNTILPLIILAAWVAICIACFINLYPAKQCAFALYRNSITSPNERIHVATFDVNEKESYNKENCDITKELFQKQPNVKVKYWCEKVYVKK